MSFKLPGLAGNKTAQQIGAVAAGFAIGGPAGAAAAYGAVSSAQSADRAISAQESANAQNIAYQKETNAQSVELANTAHQREIEDLKKAGLNPILSAGGSGAYTPSLTAPQVDSLAPTILSSAQQRNDTQRVSLQTAQVMADLKATATQAELNSALAVKARSDANLSNTTSISTAIDTARKEAELNSIAEKSKVSEFENKQRNSYPNWLKAIGSGWKDFGNTVVEPFRGVVGGSVSTKF